MGSCRAKNEPGAGPGSRVRSWVPVYWQVTPTALNAATTSLRE